MQSAQTVIVIGASTGGVDALLALAAGLPADLPAAICIVQHIGAHESILPALLSQTGALPASRPKSGDAIRSGQIYVAPPDRHMTIEPGYLRLTSGPKENLARPAIDPLFRTAAHAYGANVIGIILTGALNDGTAGLYEIKRQGGTTIVQDPADSVDPSMPRSALAHVAVDYCVPLSGLPQLLSRLVGQRAGPSNQGSVIAEAGG